MSNYFLQNIELFVWIAAAGLVVAGLGWLIAWAGATGRAAEQARTPPRKTRIVLADRGTTYDLLLAAKKRRSAMLREALTYRENNNAELAEFFTDEARRFSFIVRELEEVLYGDTRLTTLTQKTYEHHRQERADPLK